MIVGGVAVESGDLVIGDGDGVVIIPRSRLAAVRSALAGVRTAEAAMEAAVKAGLEIPEFALAVLRSNRVVEIE